MSQATKMSVPAVKFLSEKKVAELLDVSVKTLQQHRFRRKGLPYSKFGRAIRYEETTVLAYMRRHTVGERETAEGETR
jgi:phage terminase Nu1 subunit (DNA packaging protein)